MENQDNDSEFLLNARTIKLTIYVALAIGNVLFAILYPELKPVGIIGAIFFVIAFAITNRGNSKNRQHKVASAPEKTIPIERK